MPPLAPQRLKQLTGEQVAQYAKDLGRNHLVRWLNDTKRNIYKCNTFIDAAWRGSGVQLPWKGNQIPNVHGMRFQLSGDKEGFAQVWPDGQKKFSDIKINPGDVAFWDKTVYGTPIQHGAILDGDGNMLYAGSTQTGGYAEHTVNDFTKSIYGEPTIVFRYKGLQN